jgi:hypothetical protein
VSQVLKLSPAAKEKRWHSKSTEKKAKTFHGQTETNQKIKLSIN